MTNASYSYLQIPTIPKDFVHQVIAHLPTETGFDVTQQQHLAQLLCQQKVSIADFAGLMRVISERLDDEMLGYLPRAVPLGSYTALCHMLCHSPDLSAAILHYNRFYSLFARASPHGSDLLDLSELGQGKVRVNQVGEHSCQPMYQQLLVMAILKICSWLAGQKLPVQALYFGFDEIPFNVEFSYLFGVTPQYKATQTQLVFAPNALNHPISPNQSASEFSQHYLEHLLLWSVKEDVQRHVYAHIANRLGEGNFDVITIAKAMNTSKHSLARRLQQTDSSYSDILTRVRKDKALHLLLNSQTSVERIAEQLGFQEFGSFSRAFKQWTGMSPTEFRQQGGSSATIG